MRRRLLQLFNHSHVQAALVLTALLVVFLWTPLTQEGYLAPTDLLQSYIPFHTDPPMKERGSNLNY